jgi:hypothetical protein
MHASPLLFVTGLLLVLASSVGKSSAALSSINLPAFLKQDWAHTEQIGQILPNGVEDAFYLSRLIALTANDGDEVSRVGFDGSTLHSMTAVSWTDYRLFRPSCITFSS